MKWSLVQVVRSLSGQNANSVKAGLASSVNKMISDIVQTYEEKERDLHGQIEIHANKNSGIVQQHGQLTTAYRELRYRYNDMHQTYEDRGVDGTASGGGTSAAARGKAPEAHIPNESQFALGANTIINNPHVQEIKNMQVALRERDEEISKLNVRLIDDAERTRNQMSKLQVKAF